MDIFYDLVPVAGALALGRELHAEAVDAAGRAPAFIALLAESIVAKAPPIGLFGRLRTSDGRVDLKLDWLLVRQERIERRLAQHHLHEGAPVFADVERWFRTLKGLDIRVRPIRHREERRVRAHLFLCLLAGYLEWHLRRAWAPLLFDDETLADARRTRDPVAPAKPTERSRHKKASRRTDDGWPLHWTGCRRRWVGSRRGSARRSRRRCAKGVKSPMRR